MQLRIEPLGCYELLDGKLRGAFVGEEGVERYEIDAPDMHRQTQVVNYFAQLLLNPTDVVHAAQISASRHSSLEILDMFEERRTFSKKIFNDPSRVFEELFVLTGYEPFLYGDAPDANQERPSDRLCDFVRMAIQKALHVLKLCKAVMRFRLSLSPGSNMNVHHDFLREYMLCPDEEAEDLCWETWMKKWQTTRDAKGLQSLDMLYGVHEWRVARDGSKKIFDEVVTRNKAAREAIDKQIEEPLELNTGRRGYLLYMKEVGAKNLGKQKKRKMYEDLGAEEKLQANVDENFGEQVAEQLKCEDKWKELSQETRDDYAARERKILRDEYNTARRFSKSIGLKDFVIDEEDSAAILNKPSFLQEQKCYQLAEREA
eukprot:g7341.t1